MTRAWRSSISPETFSPNVPRRCPRRASSRISVPNASRILSGRCARTRDSLTPLSRSSRIWRPNFFASDMTRCDSRPTVVVSQSGCRRRMMPCTVLTLTALSENLSDAPRAILTATAAETSSSSLICRSCGYAIWRRGGATERRFSPPCAGAPVCGIICGVPSGTEALCAAGDCAPSLRASASLGALGRSAWLRSSLPPNASSFSISME